MSGTFVSVSGRTITLSHPGQPAKPNTEHAVADPATISRNGQPAELATLRAGDHVSLNDGVDPATSVIASGPK